MKRQFVCFSRSRMGLVLTFFVFASIFAFVQCAVAADTYKPECFRPLGPDTKVMKYPAKNPPYRLAFVNGFAGNAWRIQCIQALKAWANRPENKSNIKELKIVSTGTDVSAQIAAMDNYIAAGYDGIIFIAVNPDAFKPVIKRAQKAGTILVPFDNVLDTDEVVQVNEDQKKFGEMMVKFVVDNMKDKSKGKLLEVRGLQGNATDRDRHVGAQEYLKKNAPNLQVVEVVGNWDTGTTQKVVADAIATHGQFDGFFCQHGTAGVINAMLDAKHPIVPIGGDPENGVRILMAQHKIPGGTVAQSPSLSVPAMMAVIALLQGQALPQEIRLDTPSLDNAKLKDGENYFSKLPPTFFNGINFEECGMNFTAEELLKFSADNQ